MIIKVRQYDPHIDEGLIEFQDGITTLHTEGSKLSAAFSETEFKEAIMPDGVWLAFEDDKPIGAVLFGPASHTEDNCAEVFAISVDESFRQKGIGGLLMYKADLYTARNELPHLLVRTEKDNEAALTLFKKCWFNVTETSGDILTMMKRRIRRR